ncbi:hypothetical protein [Novosphingobium sp.]
MARAIALAARIHAPSPDLAVEALRRTIVCTCALALILAGRALPFF